MKKYITKQSDIKGAGKGLFTKDFFKKGEVIGLAHVDDQPASEIGRNHNHNEKNPTAYSKKINNKRFIYASKNLKPGEEITTNYRMQPELEQPEDFMRKGGSVLKMPNKKNSKGYSRSLSATNKLFTQNFLFAKPKSRKNKVFDPNSKYYAEGGALLTKKVTCKSCGWKWDAEDGGKDITTCHKCGGQGLVHAQNGNLNKFVGGGKPCDSGYYWNGKKCVLDTSNWEQSSLDSLNLYNKGEKSSGLYSMNYGPAGNYRALWRNESIKPLPEGYTVPGTIQPIGQRVTQASFPLYVFANSPARMAGTQTQYRKRVRDIYAKPVGVQKKQVFNEEPIVEKKIEEKIENLPILKPGLLQQQKYQLQGNTINEENLNLPNEEVESEYLNEGGPDTENPMEWVNKKRRYIDWNGKSLSYRLPRFRKPGSYGDLIKPGKKRYFHLPTIESRNEIYLRPKKQDGGVTKTKLSDKEEKTFQKFYNTLPNNLQSDDDTYDIRGYWDLEGRPKEFNYDQPKQDDSYYHAYSINQNTGEYLKSPAHNTFQHAIDEDRKIGYRPITNVQGRNIAIENFFIADPEEQSFLRNTEGPANYIEADLDEDEIEEYRKGGYIVEEINNFQKGGISKVSSNFSDNTKVNYQKPLVKSFNRSNNLESFYKKEREKDLQKQKNATAYHNKTNKISNNFTPKAKENLKKSPVIDNKYFINSQKNPIPMPDGYKPENTKLESIEMLYPEKYVIGPGGGLAGLGMKASKAAFAFKPISYLPSVGKALTYHSVYDATTEHIPNTVKLLSDKSKWNNDKSVELFKNLFKITSTAAGFSKYDKLKHFNRARNLGQFIDKETDANKDALKGAKMLKNFVITFKKYGGQQF